jgi:phage gp29-like protein
MSIRKFITGVWHSFAEPAPTPEAEQGKALVGTEVASTEDGRDITRGYVDNLPLLQEEDPLLVGKLGGDLDGYRAILSDPDVKIAWDQRSLGLIAREWYVEPGTEDRKSKKAADQLREVLQHIGWDEATRKMQLGVFYGRAFAECLWAQDGASITLDNLKVKKAKRFGFRPNGAPVLLTTRQPTGELLPPRKFWRFACGALDDDEPCGLGLAHWLYWPTWFRRNGEKFWAVYLEKFGMPTAVGKHPPGADDREKKKLLAAVRAVHRDSGITISDNMMINLLEATRASGADYDKFTARWTSVIYRLIIGQDFSITGAGGQYKGDNLMDVQRSIIKADADLINVSFARQVGAWLADWNYPGATPPRVWRRVEDAPDLSALADTHSKLFTVGYRPTLEQVSESYGGEWEPVNAAPPPGGDGGTAAPSALGGNAQTVEMAEGEIPAPPQGLEDAIEQLGRRAEPMIQKMMDPMRALLDEGIREGWDLAEVQRRIPVLWDRMDAADFAELLGFGMFAAELGGRSDVEGEDG